MSHLIVVDVQNERRTPGSDYNLGDLSSLVSKINTLIDHCRTHGYKIIFVRHVEKDSDEVFGEHHHRGEPIDELHRLETDLVLTKYRISPFFGTNLESEIEGGEHIAVCGVLTNLCVRSLVNDLYDRQYHTTLIEDCCMSMNPDTHQFTLEDIRTTRPEIEIMKLSEFMHE